MTDFLKKVFMTGLGALAVTVEKAGDLIEELVKRGEITLEQGKEMLKEYKEKFESQAQEFNKKIEATVTSVLSHMQIPTRDEMDDVRSRLDNLEKKSDQNTI